MNQEFQHWRCEVDTNQCFWATLDRADAPVNSLNELVLDELEEITKQASGRRGLVILSGKKTGFIAGADISTFDKWEGIEDAMSFIRKGQRVLQSLADLKLPTIALIDGFCLGGGMELALACQYRIASDSDKTRLGLPEVKLGIFPGWGGTIRLPKLIGGMQAMDLILSGRLLRAHAAKRMGLIDACVPFRQLLPAVNYYFQQQPLAHKPTFVQALTNQPWARKVIAWKVRKDLEKKRVFPNHYPQFYAALLHFEKNGVNGTNAIELEAQAIRPILEHETAKNLLRVFGLQEKLKGFAKGCDFKAEKVHVIGAGTMGAEIAAVCAMKNCRVTLQDREPAVIAKAFKLCHQIFKKKLKSKRAVEAAMDRLMPDVSGAGIQEADVIIEAIYENLEAKQALFKALEGKAKSDAILATNTSTFPLAEISTVMKAPERLIGIHFFNPVSKMQLVEIVLESTTQHLVVEKAKAFVGQIDKLPLPVKSSPGFLVNRILMPYLMECVNLVEENVSPTLIDQAAINFGMPMGPVELADKVGLDICLNGAKSLSKHFEIKIPPILEKKVEKGELGKKSGKGFYNYKAGKLQKLPAEGTLSEIEISNRLILRLLNEAVACLREKVVDDPDLIDAGMIFGTGFAPFRGGPMHYMKTRGASEIRHQLSDFEKKYGGRFNPDTGWESLAGAK